MRYCKTIFIVLILNLTGCSEKFIFQIPDDFYTIETEIVNLSPERTIKFRYDFSEHYQSAGGKSTWYYLTNSASDEGNIKNCDIVISFPREEYDYHLFIKAFNNTYKSFLYKQKKNPLAV